ncbi:MAG: Rieske 2Fe-2S domain-containing protein [Myxococcales bacterium]|nr:Rieske 2Fe-2S domain-containing protein [Myxococcales bacterium]
MALDAVAGLRAGELRRIDVAGRRLCIGRRAQGLFAVDDACPHAGGSLSAGLLAGSELICPEHAWAFDVDTGETPDDDRVRLRRYEVRVSASDGELELVSRDVADAGGEK